VAPSIDVSVCVPVYKVHEPPNVGTLAETLPRALNGLSGELVVALNGVTAMDVALPDDARAIDLHLNRGVSVGWNRAAAQTRGEILCFANDDVALGQGSLRLLAETLRARAEAGVVGPVGTRWDLGNGRHLEWLDLSPCKAGAVAECDVISGFLFATRRETFDAVGGFDEFYAPCSWEEVDFCTAVRRQLGLRCYAVAGVAHEHEFGISAPQKPWTRVRYDGRSESLWSIHRRNRRYFLAKWSRKSRSA
jgi:GT2 family glycosyltransferase